MDDQVTGLIFKQLGSLQGGKVKTSCFKSNVHDAAPMLVFGKLMETVI